jgi:MHS family proline/betaine transporter-like MFS transporter
MNVAMPSMESANVSVRAVPGPWRSLCGAALGTVVEFYDFLMFAFLLPSIARIFFPPEVPEVAALYSLMLFSVGFLARPLGGIFFGWVGDRFGRRCALTCSMVAMAVPSVLMALLPSYAAWGWWSPFVLLLLRWIQGLAAGGEYVGAVIFVHESFAPSQRIFGAAIIAIAASFGGCLAIAVSMMLVSGLGEGDDGWRLVFMTGGLMAMLGWWLRSYLPEWVPASSPTVVSGRESGRRFLCLGWLGGLAVLPFYTVTTYLPTRLVACEVSMRGWVQLGLLLWSVTVGLGIAWWVRRHPVWVDRLISLGLGWMLLGVVPLYWLLSQPVDWRWMVAASGLFFLGSQCFGVLILGRLLPLFRASSRYRTVALGYNLGVTVLSGTMPMMAQTIFLATGDAVWSGVYAMGLLLLGWWAWSGVRGLSSLEGGR